MTKHWLIFPYQKEKMGKKGALLQSGLVQLLCLSMSAAVRIWPHCYSRFWEVVFEGFNDGITKIVASTNTF